MQKRPHLAEIKQVFTPAEFRRCLGRVAGTSVTGVACMRSGMLRFLLLGAGNEARQWTLTVDGRWQFCYRDKPLASGDERAGESPAAYRRRLRDCVERLAHKVKTLRAFEVRRDGPRVEIVIVFNGSFRVVVAPTARGLLWVEDGRTGECVVASAYPDYRFYWSRPVACRMARPGERRV